MMRTIRTADLRRIPRRTKGRVLGIEQLENRVLLTVSMTAREQLILDLINRARITPQAEASRLGIDLNQGLAPGTITADRKQPLAPNQVLIDIAGAHSQEMLDYDYFNHTDRQGLSSWQRAQAAGYPSTYVGENIAYSGSSGAIDQDQTAAALHDQLFRSPGHRQNILDPNFKELGVGLRFGVYTGYNVGMVTEDFGASSQGPFLTGVVYADANGNQRYDIGEGLSGVTVTAGSASTTTGPSGGWTLQRPNGTYLVTASGGSFAGTGQASVAVNGTNVEVDFTSGFTGGYIDFQRVARPAGNPPKDLGTVEATVLTNQDPSAGPLWYRLTASHRAYLSIEAAGTSAGAAQLTLYDAAGKQLAVSSLVDGLPRIDYAAAAGQSYTVGLQGTGGLELRLVNLVSQGAGVTVYGTAGDDALEFDAADSRRVTISKVHYHFPNATSFSFNGGGGNDSAVLAGAAGGVEDAWLYPGKATFKETAASGATLFSVSISGSEQITVTSRGGQGTVRQNGQTAPTAVDKLSAYPTWSQMSGSGYTNTARSFSKTIALGTAGAGDTASLYDSRGDDTFVGRPTTASLFGPGYSYSLSNFRDVRAYAPGPGNDKAILYGSTAADTLLAKAADPATGTAGQVWLYGPSDAYYLRLANSFDRVTAYAGSASNRAVLYDSVGGDYLWASSKEAKLAYPALASATRSYPAWVVDLWNFGSVWANSSQGGRDTKHAAYDYVHATGAWINV